MATPQPTPALNLNAMDLPAAAALAGIVRSLDAVSQGQPGASPNALIAEGIAMTKQFRPKDHAEWAQMAGMMAEFWGKAARFQPHLAKHERAAREALRAAKVTVFGADGSGRAWRGPPSPPAHERRWDSGSPAPPARLIMYVPIRTPAHHQT